MTNITFHHKEVYPKSKVKAFFEIQDVGHDDRMGTVTICDNLSQILLEHCSIMDFLNTAQLILSKTPEKTDIKSFIITLPESFTLDVRPQFNFHGSSMSLIQQVETVLSKEKVDDIPSNIAFTTRVRFDTPHMLLLYDSPDTTVLQVKSPEVTDEDIDMFIQNLSRTLFENSGPRIRKLVAQ